MNGTVNAVGAASDEFFTRDRVAVVAGHRANPRDPTQFMATADAERLMGWRVGERVKFGFYSWAEVNNAASVAGLRPVHVYTETLVATVVFNDEVVRDTTDSLPALFMFTPAALRGTAAGLQYVDYHFRVAGGFAGVARVEREIIKELPPGTTYNFHDYSAVAAKVDLTNRPEALALLVFGALALLGTVLTAVQLVARRLREGRDDAAVARALGARPSAVVLDALSVPLAAVVAGAVLAVAVALALSPLSVIGPVRAVLPEGVHLEPGIVLGGAGAIVLVAAGVGWALAHRWAPGARARRARAPRSRVAAWGRATGLPTPAAVGLTFALEPGRGRTSVPVRSALVGVVAAVALVAATLTFGGGFSTLISHPSLYGWNLDNALTGSNDVPPQAIPVISKSPLVAAWAGVSYGDAQIDGQEIPVLLIRSGSSWEPPLIAGHEVESSNQIVLGAATMAELHAHLGGTVRGGYGSKRDYPVYIPPRTYRVVGVATLPAMGRSDVLHPSMGVGGVLDPAIEPPAMVKAIGTKYTALNGPQLLAVRFKPGVTRAQRTALLRQAIAAGNRAFAAVPNGQASGDLIASLGVQYPAQIISYRSTEKTPLILSLVFAAGIAVAFGLTMAASARRRRRDLALLKSLGLRRRQLAATVAAQATASVAIGLVVGVPVGVVAGRWLWDLFANSIYAVPRATVPWGALAWLVLGALVLANVVAYPSGRTAARSPVAEVLRAE